MRHAICNEVFHEWSFADAAKFVRAPGNTGSMENRSLHAGRETVRHLSGFSNATSTKNILKSEGLAFVGLCTG